MLFKLVNNSLIDRITVTWRRIEAWPVPLTAGVGLTIGALAGIGALYGAGGHWGLALLAALLLLPMLGGFMARPVYLVAEPELVDPTPPLPAAPPSRRLKVLDMVDIPGAHFMMGSDDKDSLSSEHEWLRREVSLDGFELARTPLTRGQYLAVMGAKKAPSEWHEEGDPSLPANYLTWFDAVRFCNALSRREGLELCYTKLGHQWKWNPQANGYRLPTEAEWEYACRAGSDTPWFCGSDDERLKDYAWYDEISDGKVHPVGRLKPNAFGLSDMAGNVREWCWDRYGSYPDGTQKNPIGPNGGVSRVLRGGPAWDSAWDLRSACRHWNLPENHCSD